MTSALPSPRFLWVVAAGRGSPLPRRADTPPSAPPSPTLGASGGRSLCVTGGNGRERAGTRAVPRAGARTAQALLGRRSASLGGRSAHGPPDASILRRRCRRGRSVSGHGARGTAAASCRPVFLGFFLFLSNLYAQCAAHTHDLRSRVAGPEARRPGAHRPRYRGCGCVRSRAQHCLRVCSVPDPGSKTRSRTQTALHFHGLSLLCTSVSSSVQWA